MTKAQKLELLLRLILVAILSMGVGAAIGYERGVDHSRQMIKERLERLER